MEFFQFVLKLLTFPPNWRNIEAVIQIECEQSGSKETIVYSFNNIHRNTICASNILTLEQISERNFENYTFNVSINILKIQLAIDGIYLYRVKWFINENNLTIKWRLKNERLLQMKLAEYKQGFESKIGDQMWYLSCYPNGNNNNIKNDVILCLKLHLLPLNISRLKVQLRLYCIESHVSDNNIFEFDNNNKKYSWESHTFSFDNFKSYDSITFCADIRILMVYDQMGNAYSIQQKKQDFNGKQIMNNYERQQIQITTLQKEIIDMNIKMSNITDILQNIIRNNGNYHYETYTSDDNNNNSINYHEMNQQQQKLFEWLQDVVNLSQYYHTFVDNGFEDLNSIMDITMDELKQIGIFKLGHRKKIFKHIQSQNCV